MQNEGQQARFTQILRHCRLDAFRSGNELASNRETKGNVNTMADECSTNVDYTKNKKKDEYLLTIFTSKFNHLLFPSIVWL